MTEEQSAQVITLLTAILGQLEQTNAMMEDTANGVLFECLPIEGTA